MTTENSDQCPFCDFRSKFMEKLCSHMVNKHSEFIHSLMFRKHCRKNTIQCWCGVYFKKDGPDNSITFGTRWADHLANHGGPVRHLLRLALEN